MTKHCGQEAENVHLAEGRLTFHDLATFPDDGKLRELVDGQVVEWDVPTYEHGFLLFALGGELRRFTREHHLGQVVGGDTMVLIQGSESDTRGADIAFYRRGRLPKDIRASATTTVPDLVVEIVSPSDRPGQIVAKVRDWLRAGVTLLWYVYPDTGTTAVYQGTSVRFVGPEEELDGADVLPGFRLRLQDALAELEDPQG